MIENLKRWSDIVRTKGLLYESAARSRKELVSAPNLINIASEIDAFIAGYQAATTMFEDLYRKLEDEEEEK